MEDCNKIKEKTNETKIPIKKKQGGIQQQATK